MLTGIRYEINDAWTHVDDINYTGASLRSLSARDLTSSLETNCLSSIQVDLNKQQKLETDLEELKLSLEMGYKVRYQRAASNCRAVCDSLQTKLPRELRNMVYREIIPRTYYKVERRSEDGDLPAADSSTVCISSWITPDPRNEGRWFNKDFVGSLTLCEIVQTWWELSTFEITYLSLKECSRFLSSNLWGCEVQGYSHIRHVLVRSDSAFYDDANLLSKQSPGTEYPNNVEMRHPTAPVLLASSQEWTQKVQVVYVITWKRSFDEWRLYGFQRFSDSVPRLFQNLAELAVTTAGVTLVMCVGNIKAPSNCSVKIGKRHRAMTKDEGIQAIMDGPKDTLILQEVSRYLTHDLVHEISRYWAEEFLTGVEGTICDLGSQNYDSRTNRGYIRAKPRHSCNLGGLFSSIRQRLGLRRRK